MEVGQKEKTDVPLYFIPTLSHSRVLLIIRTHNPRELVEKFVQTSCSQIPEYKGYTGHISTGNLVTQVFLTPEPHHIIYGWGAESAKTGSRSKSFEDVKDYIDSLVLVCTVD